MKNSLRSKLLVAWNCLCYFLLTWAVLIFLVCLILLITGCDPRGEIVPKNGRNAQEKRLERVLPAAPAPNGEDTNDED